jgi:DNA polymerase (family 10)
VGASSRFTIPLLTDIKYFDDMIDFEITSHLYNVATYYLLKGETRKSRAFNRAAMTLDGFGYFIRECLDHSRLMDLPGVGHSISQAVAEIIETGKLSLENDLASGFPPFLVELAAVPHFGPKLLRKLSKIDCCSIYELSTKLKEAGLNLPPSPAAALSRYISQSDPRSSYFIGIPLPIALSISSEICENLRDLNLKLAGEARMKCERVRSLDFVTCQPDVRLIARKLKTSRFCLEEPEVSEDSVQTLIFPKIHCTIRYAPASLEAFVLLNLSSPSSHLKELQWRTKEQGYQWAENSIFSSSRNLIEDCVSEKDIYALIGIDYVPPEIRHLPLRNAERLAKKLIMRDSLKGDYHIHTSSSDGIDDLDSILQRACSLDYRYLAITDHSHSLRVANGLSIGEVLRQHDKIDQINSSINPTQLLKGIEVEILPDGSLDYPPEILTGFDIVIAAIHMNTRMDPHRMTRRLLTAVRNPNVHILAHPTGRLTSRPGNFFAIRERYAFDLDLILKECAKHHVALEINAFPERLDLTSKDVQKALSYGGKIAIGSDAHAASHLSFIDFGLDVARRAGCKNSDILNTCNWQVAKKYLHSKPLETITVEDRSIKPLDSALCRSRQQHNMATLFKDLIKKNTTIVGIDLTASEERDTGWAVLKGQEVYTNRLGTDEEIIDATIKQSPDLVSIDSPLALPYGRCCERADCECRRYGITRFCERFLMSLGIGVFPCLIPSMVNLTMRGIRLAKAFEERGVSVIESYPGAAQDILGIPRKQRGIHLLRESLMRFGLNIQDTNISHDELDAITSALVGYFYLSDQYIGLGDERENDLIVPSVPAFNVENGKNHVIAIAGKTGSGKSTAALYLSLKYGFKYFRYSHIIAKLANMEGKYDKETLQEAGLRLHHKLGQREITLKLIESMPNNAHVVIDGVRWVEDLHTLQEHFVKRLQPIMIECPDTVIFKRLQNSPFFIGKTKAEIKEILTHKIESEIITLGFQMPTRIENNGSFKAYYEKLDTLIRNI